MNKDLLLQKQKEAIENLNWLCKYLYESVDCGADADWEEVFDVKSTKIKTIESKIAKLEKAIHTEPEKYADTDADGYVFCGKCGKMK